MRTNGTKWHCLGAPVKMARTADIPNEFRPSGRYAGLVQEVLDGVTSWKRGEDPIEMVDFSGQAFRPLTVPIPAGKSPIWGVHVGHKAKIPGLSPFVRPNGGWPRTNTVTLELAGTPKQPVLIRVYSGAYTPPLPWMSSARNADGGHDACVEFWRRNAYLLYSGRLIAPNTTESSPPPWWYSR